ncbi:MAG: HAD family hydrolase [Rhodobacteraceae bacterium]|nr:HAD family hydrolase [Paracoccaceae bacterium]MBO29641.1 HAD family hydrolase [Paracoccaceae bacterium]
MTAPLRLVIFDVDGTLVDSQSDIVAAMGHAFAACSLPAPDRAAVLSIVGLSLDRAMAVLAPDVPADLHVTMEAAYKDAYVELRARTGVAESSPLYPGALQALEQLAARDDVLLGVATGKSRRGLDLLIEAHGLGRFFATRQVADFHPSKPHPSMILEAMRETGAAPADTVMVGDTSFDMDMAAAAGVTGIGVSWGYHPVQNLTAARRIVDGFDTLLPALEETWKVAA